MTILIFFVVLFILILVHEWGHFIVAKKTGMRVDEFGIGFPPKLFGIKKGETEYTFNALPIGGFVRIFGENAQDAQEALVSGKSAEDSFTSKSKWAQAAVLLAGVTMNVIFAWLLIVASFMIGVPTAVDESVASESAKLTVAQVLPGSPAAEAGLPVGAEIIAVQAGDDENTSRSPEAFTTFTQEHANQDLQVTFSSGSDTQTVTVRPTTGLISDDPERPAIGIAVSLVEKVASPLPVALVDASKTTVQSLQAITVGLVTLIANSFQGTADYSQIAGPVGIVNLVGDAAEFGLTSLMMFTAIISLNLAVINMAPFPALDGGRLLFVAIEAVIRRPIAPVWVMRLNTLGFVLLMLLMLAVTYSDISKLL